MSANLYAPEHNLWGHKNHLDDLKTHIKRKRGITLDNVHLNYSYGIVCSKFHLDEGKIVGGV